MSKLSLDIPRPQGGRNGGRASDPADYRPESPKDLLGKSGVIAAAILARVTTIKHDRQSLFKCLLHGAPGTGKTTIANMIAATLAASKFDVEIVNGRNLTIEVVREWQRNACYGSLFGGWKVKVINECDLTPVAAQDLMLSYLDELPANTAVIATSNEDVASLTARFQSRFQMIRIPAPTGAEVAAWLRKRFALAAQPAKWIGETTCGNIRQALLEASSFIMTGSLQTVIKPQIAVCPARSDAAKRAWDTMRANQKMEAI